MFSMVTAMMPAILVVPLICLGFVPMRSRTGVRLFTGLQLLCPSCESQQHHRCKS